MPVISALCIMNIVRRVYALTFLILALALPTSLAVASASMSEGESQWRVDLASFGRGVAEARRKQTKSGKVAKDQYAVRWLQIGQNYLIKWRAAREEAFAPFPEYLKVSQVGFVLPGTIVLGRSQLKDVVSILGKPEAEKNGRLTYHLPSGPGDDVAVLTFSEGRLVAVEWTWFLD